MDHLHHAALFAVGVKLDHFRGGRGRADEAVTGIAGVVDHHEGRAGLGHRAGAAGVGSWMRCSCAIAGAARVRAASAVKAVDLRDMVSLLSGLDCERTGSDRSGGARASIMGRAAAAAWRAGAKGARAVESAARGAGTGSFGAWRGRQAGNRGRYAAGPRAVRRHPRHTAHPLAGADHHHPHRPRRAARHREGDAGERQEQAEPEGGYAAQGCHRRQYRPADPRGTSDKTKQPRRRCDGANHAGGAPGSGGGGLRAGDLFLDLQRGNRKLVVLGLGEEGVEPAAVIDAAQRVRRDAQPDAAFSASDCSVTSLRFGRYRRLVLLLAWLELLPVIGPFPVSSQRRDMGSSSSLGEGIDAPSQYKRAPPQAAPRIP